METRTWWKSQLIAVIFGNLQISTGIVLAVANQLSEIPPNCKKKHKELLAPHHPWFPAPVWRQFGMLVQLPTRFRSGGCVFCGLPRSLGTDPAPRPAGMFGLSGLTLWHLNTQRVPFCSATQLEDRIFFEIPLRTEDLSCPTSLGV